MKKVFSFKKDNFKEFLSAVDNGDIEKVKNTFNQEYVNKRILDEENCPRLIHKACKCDNVEIVKFLIERGSDIDQRTTDGLLPIHVACKFGCVGVVDLLLKKKNHLEVETKDKFRPIHFACKYGHVDVVLMLINHKCNYNVVTINGYTPLHIACEEGKLDIVKILLTYNCPVDSLTKEGLRPVDLAKNNKEIVTLLSENNCVFNFQENNCSAIIPENLDLENLDNYGNQIFKCVREKDISQFKVIHDPQKPIMNDNQTQLTLMEFAISEKEYEFVEIILSDNLNTTKFEKYLIHFKERNMAIFDRILEEYSIYRAIRFNRKMEIKSVSIINQNCILTGSSFLELAVKYNSFEYTSQLLKKIINDSENLWSKIKKLAQDNLNSDLMKLITDREKYLLTRSQAVWSRLHIAVEDNEIEVVKYLLKSEPETQTFYAAIGSPLNLAAICGRIECFQLLFAKYSKLKNSFHVAIKNGMGNYCVNMIHLLSDYNEVDEDRNSLLHLSAKFLSLKLCTSLLENNCDPNITNNSGNTPLHEMVSFNLHRLNQIDGEFESIFRLILNHKTDVNKKNNNDVSVFQECLAAKNLKLIYLITSSEVRIEVSKNDLKIIMENNWVDVLEHVLPQCLEANQLIDENMLIYFLKYRPSESFNMIWFLTDPEIKKECLVNMLYQASIENKEDIFKILCDERECSPKNLENEDTLLITLLKMRKLEFCSLLINSNLSDLMVNESNSIKETPLHIAAKYEFFNLLENMLFTVEDVNKEDYSGNTAFSILINNDNSSDEVERLSKFIISKSALTNQNSSSLLKSIENCKNENLKAKLLKLHNVEMERKAKNQDIKNICNVCLDQVVNISFNCGHTSCKPCSSRLQTCPICRNVIKSRNVLFL